MSQIPVNRGNPQFSDIAAQTATPMIGGLSREDGQTILNNIDSELAKIFENQNMLLTGGGTITNTGGTSLSFTSNFTLYINSNIAGASPYTLSIGSSPWAFTADGNMAYILITSRSAGTFTLFTDVSSLPAVNSTNQEVLMIAKRVGTSIWVGGKTSIPSGASVVLGTISASGADKQVQYNNSGALAGSSSFIWDYSTNSLGVGASPTSTLYVTASAATFSNVGSSTSASIVNQGNTTSSIASKGNSTTTIQSERYSTDASGPTLVLRKARGSVSGQNAIASSDTIGSLLFQVYGGTNSRNIASINGVVDTYTSDSNISSYLTFSTSSSGSVTATERMRIKSDGTVGINQTAPTNYLHVTYNETTPSAASTQYPIKVHRTWTNNTTDLGNGIIFSDQNSDQAAVVARRNNIASNNRSDLVFYVNDNTSSTSIIQRMILDSNGRLSVGTTTASYRTNIQAAASTDIALEIQQGSGATNAGMHFTNTAGSIEYGTLLANSTNFSLGTSGATYLSLLTNNSERIRIDSSGNVGVGITPYSKFNVYSISDWPIGQRLQNNTVAARNTLLQQRSLEVLGFSAAVQSGYYLGGLSIGGYDGTNWSVGSDGGAEIISSAAGNWSPTARGARFSFFTTPAGTITPKLRMTMEEGYILMGQNPLYRTASSAASHNNPSLLIESFELTGGLAAISNSADINGSYLILGKSRGTTNGSFTAVNNGDILGRFIFTGADGSSGMNVGALIDIRAEQAFASGANESKSSMNFYTSGGTGIGLINRATINSSGNLILFASNQTTQTHSFEYNEGGGEINLKNSSGTNTVLIDYNSSAVAARFGTVTSAKIQFLVNADNICEVNSAASTPAFYVKNPTATASSSNVVIAAQYTGDVDCTGGYFFDCRNSSGSTIGRIEATDNTHTLFTGSSDSRLKQNLSTFDGLSKLNLLKPVEFEWISSPGKRDTGFIAQELHEVIPGAVSVGSDELTEDGSLRNPWGADYSKIVPVLVKAVQELSAELNALKATLGK